MNAATDNRTARPWYREPWPWALMLPPLLAVAGGVTMILLATRTPSALVVEDYARIEELTAERFERDLSAARLGIAATLSAGNARARFSADPAADASNNVSVNASANASAGTDAAAERRRLRVMLTAPDGFAMPRALVLHLRHATNPEADQELRLVRFGDAYAADVEFAAGRYGIELMPEDESWRLSAGVARLQGEIPLVPQTSIAQGAGNR